MSLNLLSRNKDLTVNTNKNQNSVEPGRKNKTDSLKNFTIMMPRKIKLKRSSVAQAQALYTAKFGLFGCESRVD